MLDYAAIVRGDYLKLPYPDDELRVARNILAGRNPNYQPPVERSPSPLFAFVEEPLPELVPDPEDDYMRYASPNATKNILGVFEYRQMMDFIEEYEGLAIDCRREMISTKFTHIDPQTIAAIVELFFINRACARAKTYRMNRYKYVSGYDMACKTRDDPLILVNMAIKEQISPVILCRMILKDKQNCRRRGSLSGYLKNPTLIYDRILQANVRECLRVDITDGPIITTRRHEMGVKYETLLQDKLREANVRFINEKQMRERFYAKTPDVKIEDKLYYKGKRVFWIESKATFGDKRNHKQNITHQLSKYNDLYGPGIVIYWFGYVYNIPHMTKRKDGITVLHEFPPLDDLRVVPMSTPDGGGDKADDGNGEGVGDGDGTGDAADKGAGDGGRYRHRVGGDHA